MRTLDRIDTLHRLLLALQLLPPLAAIALLSRTSLGGAWAMVLLGAVVFGVALVVHHRVEARLLAPVAEAIAVLTAVRSGDSYRRWAPVGGEGSVPLGDDLNWLLDQRLASPEAQALEDPRVRAALLALLDREDNRVVLVADPEGELLAVNRVGLEAETGFADVASSVGEGEAPEGWEITPLVGAGWLARGPITES